MEKLMFEALKSIALSMSVEQRQELMAILNGAAKSSGDLCVKVSGPAVANVKMILAIKLFREVTGADLKSAKSLYDNMSPGFPVVLRPRGRMTVEWICEQVADCGLAYEVVS